uniref:DUF4371 domain-containing protein n=1 Tax=Myripristis murdjan TaxID=586833 RepID=A0A668AN63_9TELE
SIHVKNYILYGFTSTSADPPQPQCFFCGEVLSNKSVKPSGQTVMMKATGVSSKALEASYAVSLLVAKSKKPHSTVEELILPAATVMAEIMIDKKAANAFKKVPLSNNTMSRRIDEMSVDIIGQVVNKIKQAGQFALQLDEMTDVSGDAQLLAFIRYKDVSDIKENILFCKRLPGKTTGEEMFQWKTCTHICTDDTAAMTGSVKGLFGHVKKVNPNIKWMHCIIHREALARKIMSPDLSAVMDDAVKVINLIQSRPLNHRLFVTLCHESSTEHEQLLLHTDVRWLSRGKRLLRLFELRSEVFVFLTEHLHPLAVVFEDARWVAHLAYLAYVFTKLNELNLLLQGKESHILKMYDKVKGFTKKLKLWERKLVKLVQAHLSKLCTDFSQYFQDIEEKSERLDWVRNPFSVSESSNNLPARLQEHLMDLSSDRGLKMAYAEKTLTEFWCDVEKEYPELGKHALIELLPFGFTYMCEVTFSALTHIKTKQRNRLDVENSLVAAVSTLPTELSKLMKDKQAQESC